MADKSSPNVSVEIAPNVKGYVTPRGLINPAGTIKFESNYSQVGGDHAGFVFRVQSPEYRFEASFTKTHLYVLRNGHQLETPIQPVKKPNGHVMCFVIWEVDYLALIMLDESFRDATSGLSTEEAAKEVEKRRIVLKTPPTLPPNSLLRWARQQSIVSTAAYASFEQFRETVASSLESIADSIASLNSINGFWDITYEGARIIDRKPKRETDIHPTLNALLYNIATAKNLEVVREYTIAGGQLDFLISAPLANGQTAAACVEFKHAHSTDTELLHGLLKQLPAYMQAKGSSFGIYCALWFKGLHFEEPKKHQDQAKLLLYLDGHKRRAGLSDIRIMTIDLSIRLSPSKL